MWGWLKREAKVGLWYLFWPLSKIVGTPSEAEEDLPRWVKLVFALTVGAMVVAMAYVVIAGVD